MSLWQNFKKFTGPYPDDEYDDEYADEADDYEAEEEEAPQPSSSRSRRPSPFATETESSSSASSASSTSSTSSGAASTTAFNGQILNVNTGSKQEVVLFHAKSFDDTGEAADELRKRKAVILNMENVDKALTRRVVDFLSGSVYALDGSVKKIAQSTYLFCPHNMTVVGDLENLQSEAENYI